MYTDTKLRLEDMCLLGSAVDTVTRYSTPYSACLFKLLPHELFLGQTETDKTAKLATE